MNDKIENDKIENDRESKRIIDLRERHLTFNEHKRDWEIF